MRWDRKGPRRATRSIRRWWRGGIIFRPLSSADWGWDLEWLGICRKTLRRAEVFGASTHCRVAERVSLSLSLSLPTSGLGKLSYFNGDHVCGPLLVDHGWSHQHVSITPSCMNCGLIFCCLKILDPFIEPNTCFERSLWQVFVCWDFLLYLHTHSTQITIQ